MRVTLESFLVTEVVLEDGTVEERFTPAEQAFPGQVIEYRLTVTNVSDAVLPPGNVAVTGPVPEGTSFVPGSANMDPDALRVAYSADQAVTFSEPPLTITVTNDAGEEEQVEVEPSEYDAVRWTLLVPLEPDASRTMTYRVQIDE